MLISFIDDSSNEEIIEKIFKIKLIQSIRSIINDDVIKKHLNKKINEIKQKQFTIKYDYRNLYPNPHYQMYR